MGKTKHGMSIKGSVAPTYYTWVSMKSRCHNPKARSYENYGGKGITVCDRWFVFENFLADMGERKPKTTLDRIDNSKGYFRENCRWASVKTQSTNRKNSVWVSYKGKKIHNTELLKSASTKIERRTLLARIKRGWSIEKSISVPVGDRKDTISYLIEKSKSTVPRGTIYRRIFQGWSIADAIATPPIKGYKTRIHR